MGGILVVVKDVQDVRAIGQKVNEQGEQDGEGEEFHDKHLARLNNIRQAPLLNVDYHPLKPPQGSPPRPPLNPFGLPSEAFCQRGRLLTLTSLFP